LARRGEAVKVFIDSGGWLSVIIESDQYHEAGRSYFEALMALGAALETSDFVLDEVITRLRYDAGHAEAAQFLRLVHEAVNAGALKVHRVSEVLWGQAEEIFLRYGDVRLSFTDCTSFALIHEHPVDEVFAFDAHFEMMGNVLQPKP
jgi:predicted nucleic acid-binding protein